MGECFTGTLWYQTGTVAVRVIRPKTAHACLVMGQHCSCMEQSRKYQRRHSDDVDTMDMERGDEDDGDQEMEILVGHDHEQEMQEVFGTRVSSCRSNQRGRLKRTGFSIAIGLLEDVDKREDEKEEEQHRTGLMGLETDYRPTPLFSPEELAKLLRSYQEATGVVDEGQLELECIMCLDTFSQDNPKIRTLCNCGMNRTNFHMSCLFEWLNREANCPVCREYLFFED